MNNINSIVRLDSGEYFYFFYDSKNGICYREGNNSEVEVLLKNGNDNFSLAYTNNIIHLICSDTDNNIVYLSYENNKWSKYVILKSKGGKTKPDNFEILIVNNWINIFYNLYHDNRLLLVHQIINNQNTSPIVIDYIRNLNNYYRVIKDYSGNILVFYYLNKSFGVRKYEWARKSWSDFYSIFNKQANIINPSIIYDGNTFHLTFLIKNKSYYDIGYNSTDDPYTSKIDDINIIRTNIKYTMPLIHKIDNYIYISWKTSNLYSIYSHDNGKIWSKPSFYQSASQKPEVVKFLHSSKNKIICNYCYAFTQNKIYIYNVSEYIKNLKQTNESKIESAYPLKNTSQNSNAERKTNNMDLEKIKISHTMLHNELKSVNHKLNNLNTRIASCINKQELDNIKKKISELEKHILSLKPNSDNKPVQEKIENTKKEDTIKEDEKN